MERFDAVVVGAGVSGLSAGILLAERGRRVLVLEHHTIPGGLLQQFRRKGIPLETGFHYVGGAGAGGPLRRYLRRLGVLDRIRLVPMDPEGFDEVVFPGRRVAFPQGQDRLRAHLQEEFPGDAGGVARYFDLVSAEVEKHPFFSFRSEHLGDPPAPPEELKSLAAVLSGTVRDSDLAAVLASHGVLYGVPASRAPFAAHARGASSFYHSSQGMVGGGEALAAALVARLRELGGELRLRNSVEAVEIQGRRVRKVVTGGGDEFEPGVLVWSAHPAELVRRTRGESLPSRHLRRLSGLRNTASAILLHAVARGVPAVEARRNRLWFREPAEAMSEVGSWIRGPAGPARAVVLPGLPLREAPGDTAFQVWAPVIAEDMEEAGIGRAREGWKHEVALTLLPIVDACVPEWSGRVEVVNVSTPRAIEGFVRSPGGSCYGLESTVASGSMAKLPSEMGTAGLLLVGQNLGLPGVLGSMVSAFHGVGHLERCLPDLYLDLRNGDPIIPPGLPGRQSGVN